MIFCRKLPYFTHIRPPSTEIWRHIDFKDTGCGRSILLPVSYLLMSLSSEGQSLSANQILSTLTAEINYFRFLKTIVRHIGILFPVSISTSSPSSACYSASGCPISSKSKHSLQKYDVVSISQDDSRDRWILLQVSYLYTKIIFFDTTCNLYLN